MVDLPPWRPGTTQTIPDDSYGLIVPGWIPASWRAGQPGFTGTSGAVNTNENSCLIFPFPTAMNECRVVFCNAGASPVTVRASAMGTSFSTIAAIYFNGQRDIVIPADPNVVFVSDPIPIKVAAGGFICIRTKTSVPAGQGWQLMHQTFIANDAVADQVGALDQTLTAGTVGAGFAFGPTLILGRPPAKAPFIAVIGDSITGLIGTGPNGYTDTWHRLALGNAINYAAFGVAGAIVSQFTSDAHLSTTTAFSGIGRSLASGATHVFLAYGTNDVFSSLLTLAQLQGNFLTAWKQVAAMGKKVYAATIVPRTTSTDGWVTTANQTTISAPQEAIRRQFNSWVRSLPNPLAGYFEWADASEPSRNAGVWQAGFSVDGVHPNGASGAGLAALAGSINPAIFT